MKKYKLIRNLWLFAGICFLISSIISVKTNKSYLALILNVITSILMFINAYINHKKVIKGDKD